jgi:protein TonB
MGYQALLFCPDEKTAGVVTQVLNELEFSVEPANEPFAAVKRLTTQHFDAVVVDCENEQNAALLFKSARNSGPNRTSLAVAVVEGQPGIAKAFRIGANLVLTKPINVEQSKGTLRVARGLLKKGEAGKAAAAVTPSITPAPPARPAPANPAASRPLTPAAQTLKPVPPKFVTTPPAPVVRAEAPSILELDSDPGPQTEAVDAALLEAMPDPVAPSPARGVGKNAPWPPNPGANPFLMTNTPTSDGAAVAPARETAPRHTEAFEPRPASSKPARQLGGHAAEQHTPAPSFGVQEKAPSGGGMKWVLGAVVLIVVAAAGYFGGAKFHKNAESPVSTAPAETAPAQTVQATPSSATPAPAPAPPAATPTASQPKPSAVQNNDAAPESDDSEAPARKSSSPTKASAAPEKPVHEALVIKNSPKTAVAEAAPQAIPAIGMAPVANDKALAGIIGAAPSGRAPVLHTMKISQGVSQGLVVKKVAPEYPAQARQLRIEGAVQLEMTVNKDGSVTAVKVLGGHPMLARAAVDAVKQWKYRPYLLNGQPVEIETQITVNFKLP